MNKTCRKCFNSFPADQGRDYCPGCAATVTPGQGAAQLDPFYLVLLALALLVILIGSGL